jgi:hypothetical protein
VKLTNAVDAQEPDWKAMETGEMEVKKLSGGPRFCRTCRGALFPHLIPLSYPLTRSYAFPNSLQASTSSPLSPVRMLCVENGSSLFVAVFPFPFLPFLPF